MVKVDNSELRSSEEITSEHRQQGCLAGAGESWQAQSGVAIGNTQQKGPGLPECNTEPNFPSVGSQNNEISSRRQRKPNPRVIVPMWTGLSEDFVASQSGSTQETAKLPDHSGQTCKPGPTRKGRRKGTGSAGLLGRHAPGAINVVEQWDTEHLRCCQLADSDVGPALGWIENQSKPE